MTMRSSNAMRQKGLSEVSRGRVNGRSGNKYVEHINRNADVTHILCIISYFLPNLTYHIHECSLVDYI